MNSRIASYIHDNIDEILEKWRIKMEEEKDDRFFQIMSNRIVDNTVREFGELMISSLTEDRATYTAKLNDFSVQIVHYGWSISFVLKALTNFTEIIYEKMDDVENLDEGNFQSYREILNNWIIPLNHSIVDAYSVVWEKTVSLQKIALQELSASLIPVFETISVMPLA